MSCWVKFYVCLRSAAAIRTFENVLTMKQLVLLAWVLLTSQLTFAQDTLLYFSWNTSVTVPDIGPAGFEASTASLYAEISAGGANGTNGLNPGRGPGGEKADLDITFPSDPVFDVGGIDIALDYQRDETAGTLFSRGSGFKFGEAQGASVTYRVDNGDGSFNAISSGLFETSRTDEVFHNIRFVYEPATGNASLRVDGTEVWTNPTKTPGKDLYWDGGAPILIGTLIDGSGENKPVLDNLVFRSRPSAVGLPIRLAVFEAVPLTDRRVGLEWQTDSEWDNDYFTIERSESTSGQWQTVHRVKGQGNSNELTAYQAEDWVPHGGVFYYRLQQVDYDGSRSYSAIKSVVMDASAAPDATVYPNPTTGTLYLKGAIEGEGYVRIVDAAGRDLSGEVIQRWQDREGIRLDLSALPTGVYTLIHGAGTHRIVKR